MPVTVQPGDFCAMPMGPPAGLLVSAAEWLADLGQRGDRLPQDYGHAEIWAGDLSGTGLYPYGATVSAYPNRQGIRVLDRPPGQVPGALWSSGLVSLTPAQREAVVTWCLEHSGVGYGAADYLQIALHRAGAGTSWLRHRIESDQSYICSQFVDAAYQAAGVQLFSDGRWNGDVMPLDLALLLEELRAGQA